MKNIGPLARVFLSLFGVALILTFLVRDTAHFSYDYKKGQPWKYDNLYAQFDFPIIKSEEQLLTEKINFREKVVPYYKFSSDQVNKALRQAERLELGKYKSAVISELRAIYEKGIVGDDGVGENVDVIYVQKDKRASKRPATDVYRLSDARAKLLEDIRAISDDAIDSLFKDLGVYDLLVPNLIFDEQTTNLVSAREGNAVSPTSGFVSSGELIVSNGEIITAEVFQMIDSYKKEYEASLGRSGSGFLFWLGNLLVLVAMLTVFYFVIRFTSPGVLYDKRFYYLLLLFFIFAAVTLIVVRFNESWLYLVPFTLSALFLNAFFRPKVIMAVYIVSLLPLLVYAHNGMVLFVMFLTSGAVSIFVFKRFHKGWRQFVSAMLSFAVLAVVYFAFRLLDAVHEEPLRVMISLFLSSLLNVLGYPLVFIFEKMFNLVSSSRLIELCDTSNPLLRELEKKAPGTFQHSLQVMNLADAAARSIDANVNLVRAASLYHDIGKINNPQCFVENESLIDKAEADKYHASITPEQSAQDIIRHVTDGVSLAESNGLPDVVVDFIRSHHGTSKVGYFYNLYLNNGGDPSHSQWFTYEGRRPASKEEVILMLCDSLEAASRTLKDYSQESISAFVERIIKSKMDEMQFEEADITIREISVLRETLKNYLAQMHHERIVYPQRNKSKQNNN